MLSEEVKEELIMLTKEQREIVLKGLDKKLSYYQKTGILSYKYEVCPVCNDVGSTLENPKCDECYIKISCKEPFNKGFRDDPEKGFEYFSAMRRFILSLISHDKTIGLME